MGALSFAARKFAGIGCGAAGLFFGAIFLVMSFMSPVYSWVAIPGVIMMLAGIIFGIYFWRSADRHV